MEDQLDILYQVEKGNLSADLANQKLKELITYSKDHPNFLSFKQGFYAAVDTWNEKFAGNNGDSTNDQWLLVPDKYIGNKWWKWLENNENKEEENE